eukprot:122927-Hanusia_phi.AAC.3
MQTTFCIYSSMQRRRESLESSRESDLSTLKVPIWPSQDFRYVRDFFISPRDKLLVAIGQVVPSQLVDRKTLNELSLLSVKPLVQLTAQNEMMKEMKTKTQMHLHGLKRPNAKHAEAMSQGSGGSEQKRKLDEVSGSLDAVEEHPKKLRHVSSSECGRYSAIVCVPSQVSMRLMARTEVLQLSGEEEDQHVDLGLFESEKRAAEASDDFLLSKFPHERVKWLLNFPDRGAGGIGRRDEREDGESSSTPAHSRLETPSMEIQLQAGDSSRQERTRLKPLKEDSPTLVAVLEEASEEGEIASKTFLWEEKMVELELQDSTSDESDDEEDREKRQSTATEHREEASQSHTSCPATGHRPDATTAWPDEREDLAGTDTSKEDERIARELAQNARQPQPSATDKPSAHGYPELLLECSSCHSICGVARGQLGKALECPICRQRFRACLARA